MDDLSNLLSQVTGGGTATGVDPAKALGDLLGQTAGPDGQGGLDDLVSSLKQGGLGPQVDSWVSDGPNESVTADQVGAALGPEKVQALSGSTGLDIGSLLPMLAMFLPMIINGLTPQGKLPDQDPLKGGAAGGIDLGSILGGLGGMLGGQGR